RLDRTLAWPAANSRAGVEETAMAGKERPPTQRSQAPSEPARRGFGLRAVAATVASVAGPALKKRGLAQGRLLTDWPEIVGAKLAEISRPEKLVSAKGADGGGTLEVRVAGPWAVEIQHLAPTIVERINRYFGYAAVARLRLVNAPLAGAAPAPRPVTAPPDPATKEKLDVALAGIDDPALREALAGLGRALLDGGSPDKPAGR
ncbi:MAG: DUF721 domain-containing protein, partial [Candidatus Eiseniibacteriota bacterium]